jgi:stage II sporulation protein AA (anti-sigma F factor antagonist)
VVIAIDGEIDIANARAIEATLLGVEAAGVQDVVLDLTGVEFLASAGLRVILDADERARARGRRLTLLASPAVRWVTDLAGLTESLAIAA